MMGLGDKAHLRPAGLTQIEMRKLELARAMAARPKLLISDEAMAGLTSAEVDDILSILFRLNAQGITIIMIEHIMRAVMRFSERIVVLDAGARIAEGTPDEIVQKPGRGEGLPWRVGSSCATWRPATVRCACCTACRSRSARARRSPSSAPTATARAP